jgi:hypothetical protein
MAAKIPVFVSAPTALNAEQEAVRELIIAELEAQHLEARALGRTDYPADCPIREVYSIAQVCAGGVILGFSQYDNEGGMWKRGTTSESSQVGRVVFPSQWNNLEAGILYGLNLPLLVFREPEISGGIFDAGVSELFVNQMPTAPLSPAGVDSLRQLFLKWSAKVRPVYYRDRR